MATLGRLDARGAIRVRPRSSAADSAVALAIAPTFPRIATMPLFETPDAPSVVRLRCPVRVAVPAALLVIAVCGACRPPAPPPSASTSSGTGVASGWPRTVAEAVELKLRTMSDGEKSALRQTPRDRVQDAYHGFQMLHRADFGLSEGNEQLLASCGSVRMPAEECMRIILDALWVALQGSARELTPTG